MFYSNSILFFSLLFYSLTCIAEMVRVWARKRERVRWMWIEFRRLLNMFVMYASNYEILLNQNSLKIFIDQSCNKVLISQLYWLILYWSLAVSCRIATLGRSQPRYVLGHHTPSPPTKGLQLYLRPGTTVKTRRERNRQSRERGRHTTVIWCNNGASALNRYIKNINR